MTSSIDVGFLFSGIINLWLRGGDSTSGGGIEETDRRTSLRLLLMCLKRPIGQKDRFKRFFESFYTKNIFLTSF